MQMLQCSVSEDLGDEKLLMERVTYFWTHQGTCVGAGRGLANISAKVLDSRTFKRYCRWDSIELYSFTCTWLEGAHDPSHVSLFQCAHKFWHSPCCKHFALDVVGFTEIIECVESEYKHTIRPSRPWGQRYRGQRE